MDSRLVLVIEGDDSTANRLAAAIREADYEVVVSNGARAGLDIAIEIKPDCVVCDVSLPDEDGYWVARHIRTHPSQVSVTPFLFLSEYDDAESRLQGFHVGADVYMTKPFEVEEVVAQVDALVKLAGRLRQRRDSMLSIPPEETYGSMAIEGDLRQMSVATVLSVLGMERRTGVFEVVSKKRRAQIEIAGGYVVHGTIGGTRVSALAAIGLMMSWKVGRFSFVPLPPTDPPPSRRTVQALLLDAAKAEDEAAASLPSAGAPGIAFGGPPSRPDDTGPPSSRALRDSGAPPSISFDLIPSRRAEDMPAAEVAAAVDPAVEAYESRRGAPVARPTRPAGPPRDVAPKGGRVAVEVRVEAGGTGDSISVDLSDTFELDGFGDPDLDAAIAAERTRLDGTGAPPTPRTGASAEATRGTPAIVPPPASGARMERLPAPPAPPRPGGAPRPPAGKGPGVSPKKS